MGPWDTTNQLLKSILVKAEPSDEQKAASEVSFEQGQASKKLGAMAEAMQGGKGALKTHLTGYSKWPGNKERLASIKAGREERLAASNKEDKAAQRKKWGEAERSGKAVRVGTRHEKGGEIVAETGDMGPMTDDARKKLVADVTAGHAPSKREHAAMQKRNLAPAIGLEGRWGVPRRKARFVEKVGSMVHAVKPAEGDKGGAPGGRAVVTKPRPGTTVGE